MASGSPHRLLEQADQGLVGDAGLPGFAGEQPGEQGAPVELGAGVAQQEFEGHHPEQPSQACLGEPRDGAHLLQAMGQDQVGHQRQDHGGVGGGESLQELLQGVFAHLQHEALEHVPAVGVPAQHRRQA